MADFRKIFYAFFILLLPFSLAGSVEAANETVGLKYVLVETKVNPFDKPLRNTSNSTADYGYGRVNIFAIYEGDVSASEITFRHRVLKNGKEDSNWLYKWNFDSPPREIVQGENFTIKVSGTLTGTGVKSP